MPIIDTLNIHTFIDRFPGDKFSREALERLYEYYDELSEDIGEDIEFDPVGFCGEWGEYSTEKQLENDYTEHDGNARKILADNGVLYALPSGGFLVKS